MAKKTTSGKTSGKKAEKASEAKSGEEKTSAEKTAAGKKTSAEKTVASETSEKTENKASSEGKKEKKSDEKKPAVNEVNFSACPGQILILRLFLKNKHLVPMLVRLSVDDWVTEKGDIFSTHNRVEPGYLYILQEGEAAATISLLVPEEVEDDSVLMSNLRFPGANEMPLTIRAEISSKPKEHTGSRPVEKSLQVSLPFGKAAEEDEETKNEERISIAVYQLVNGLSNLSALPSQWLFAEGLVLICMEGERISKEKDGIKLFSRLSRTRLYKNLTLAFTTARFPQWVSGTILSSSSLHTAMGGQFGQGRIIYIWLKWLFGLADTDIEDGEQKSAFEALPKAKLEEAVTRYGSESQLWAGYLLLGLTTVSPKIESLIKDITKNLPDEEKKNEEPPKNIKDVINENGPLTK